VTPSHRHLAAFVAPALIAPVLALLAISLVPAQSVLGQAGVVICDINQVFEKHPQFTAELAKLKTDAESLQAAVTQQRQQLAAQAEQLSLAYRVGTTEYSDAEKSLAMESAKVELEARDSMRELTRREARLHYDIYQQVTGVISRYSQETGTPLVLRFNAAPMIEGDPDSIMQQVNAAVVWHRPDRNVTTEILKRMAQLPPSGTGATETSR
jgi:Outer membrane protein (OmpH-like)